MALIRSLLADTFILVSYGTSMAKETLLVRSLLALIRSLLADTSILPYYRGKRDPIIEAKETLL